jgi:hypothetical protein
MKLENSKGLTFYPTASLEDAAVEIPEHQRSIARPDDREDEDYNRDVENLTHKHQLGQFRENPLGFMIRLTAESSAFYQVILFLLALMQ